MYKLANQIHNQDILTSLVNPTIGIILRKLSMASLYPANSVADLITGKA